MKLPHPDDFVWKCQICGATQGEGACAPSKLEWEDFKSKLFFEDVGYLKGNEEKIGSLECEHASYVIVRKDADVSKLRVGAQNCLCTLNFEDEIIGAFVYSPGYHGVEGPVETGLVGILVKREVPFKENIIRVLRQRFEDLKESLDEYP